MAFEVNQTYSFKTYAPTILSDGFSNVIVKGIISYSIARTLADVDAIHAQIYTYLQDKGVPNQPEKYSYIQVQFPNGTTTVLGIPWIDSSTVTMVDSVKINVLIDNVSSTDTQKINDILKANGYASLTVTIV